MEIKLGNAEKIVMGHVEKSIVHNVRDALERLGGVKKTLPYLDNKVINGEYGIVARELVHNNLCGDSVSDEEILSAYKTHYGELSLASVERFDSFGVSCMYREYKENQVFSEDHFHLLERTLEGLFDVHKWENEIEGAA